MSFNTVKATRGAVKLALKESAIGRHPHGVSSGHPSTWDGGGTTAALVDHDSQSLEVPLLLEHITSSCWYTPESKSLPVCR